MHVPAVMLLQCPHYPLSNYQSPFLETEGVLTAAVVNLGSMVAAEVVYADDGAGHGLILTVDDDDGGDHAGSEVTVSSDSVFEADVGEIDVETTVAVDDADADAKA